MRRRNKANVQQVTKDLGAGVQVVITCSKGAYADVKVQRQAQDAGLLARLRRFVLTGLDADVRQHVRSGAGRHAGKAGVHRLLKRLGIN